MFLLNQCEKIKHDTRQHHHQVNHAAFMQRLITGQLQIDDYVTYLRALAIIYAVLETQICHSKNPAHQAVWQDDMRKLPLLTADIACFGQTHWADACGPIKAARAGATLIRTDCLAKPLQLLGYLYVLEGSTNGGSLLFPRVQQAFNLSGSDGTAYLQNYQDPHQAQWLGFKQRLEQTITSDDDLAAVITGAKTMYHTLTNILLAFEDDHLGAKVHATAFNPEAGNHPVPQQTETIKAAVTAAELVYQQMPYLAARYGQRGEQFTHSDSAWLATLPALPAPRVCQQVHWLARLLSGLGLPRAALVMHLNATAEHLIAIDPQQAENYSVLYRAAQQLIDQTNQHIPENLQRQVIEAFYQHTAGHPQAGYFAELLVSAKADEIIDQSTILSELMLWLDETPHGWPEPIITAAHQLVCTLKDNR